MKHDLFISFIVYKYVNFLITRKTLLSQMVNIMNKEKFARFRNDRFVLLKSVFVEILWLHIYLLELFIIFLIKKHEFMFEGNNNILSHNNAFA